MRYKVGDKVRVRQWDDMVEEFGTDEVGRIDTKTGCRFMEEMKKFCGGVYEICSMLGRNYLLRDGEKTIYYYFTDETLEDVNLLLHTPNSLILKTENVTLTFGKNTTESKSKKEGKEMKQKTQRERLEEQLKKYQDDSGIKSVEIVVPEKVVKVTMDNHIGGNTYTMKCHEEDEFSLERAIILAYVKNGSWNFTPEGIEYEANRFYYYKSNVRKLKKAMKVYETQQKMKALDEEEERIRANKKRKKIAQKKRRLKDLRKKS